MRKNSIGKESVEPFFEEWDRLKELIENAHKMRSSDAKELMEQGIQLYESLITKTSDTESFYMDCSETYEVLPINGMERLQFIKHRPGQFACFRQLDELFKETKKRLARLRITK